MLDELTVRLENRQNLSLEQMTIAMNEILQGVHTDEIVAKFLQNLSLKGETDDELLAMLNKMKQFSVNILPNCESNLVDMCGTGGDNLKTFNISTSASFVVAAAGGYIAKHGNRSVSGISGSADIFEYFGFDLGSEPTAVANMIEKIGIGFMFAPKFHPAMKNVVKARRILGKRTAFNLLGPLSNPANVKHQLIGVFADDYIKRIVKIMQKNNSETILAVRSDDGMDEISPFSITNIVELKNGKVNEIKIDPKKIGINFKNINNLKGQDADYNAKKIIEIFSGVKNEFYEAVSLNAAAALVVSNKIHKFEDGFDLAKKQLESGKVLTHLKKIQTL